MYLGIDLGTSEVKVLLLEESGEIAVRRPASGLGAGVRKLPLSGGAISLGRGTRSLRRHRDGGREPGSTTQKEN
jgi:hypothetical protein